MKKLRFFLPLVLAAALCGCAGGADSYQEPPEESTVVETTVPVTVPDDGNPGDVTCKGTYSAAVNDAVVATVGDAELTNRELQAWYWAEAARYQQEDREQSPDFSAPLDTQVCQIDSSVGSWQQYFLREALNAWHTAQALVIQSEEIPMPTEDAYQPNRKNYETYMTGMPAAKYLYGYHAYYRPNTLHEEYLTALPEQLGQLAQLKGYSGIGDMAGTAFGTTEEALMAFADIYNRAYMYFTALSHYIEPSEEELAAYAREYTADAADGRYVDIRHILLNPEGDWDGCEDQANEMLEKWKKENRCSEATFAELAVKHSQDKGTALDGGAYHKLTQGVLMQELDAWCFEEARQSGDTAIIRSDLGIHILYFVSGTDAGYAEAEDAYYRMRQQEILNEAREDHPMEADYSAMTLATARGGVSAGEILYPDIAHERFPEVPLYLQQDYPKTMYGGFKITTNGCGITSMAMLASYLADDELTPPEMCAKYGNYSHANGTDGMIFIYEPATMGFYLREKTYDPKLARAALEEGHLVLSIQHPGYWTRGGHYIVCESITEDGMVQVRDSNIYNYSRVRAHVDDLHKWGNITANGSGFWIFEHKITRIPACSRCGTEESITGQLLNQAYTCHKCETALLRRNTYMTN